jgi:hypothetical protein
MNAAPDSPTVVEYVDASVGEVIVSQPFSTLSGSLLTSVPPPPPPQAANRMASKQHAVFTQPPLDNALGACAVCGKQRLFSRTGDELRRGSQ